MLLLTPIRRQEAISNEKPFPAQTILNVAYGEDSLQKMDAHLPEGRTENETWSLVLIHGGSWNGGNKSDFNPYVDSLKRRLPNYAIFNLNYRLFNGGHKFPTQENDVKQAIEYIVRQSSEYKFNKNRMVVLGASAGAHLAMLQAYKNSEPKIAGVIDFFGPTDLTAMYTKPWHPYLPAALQMVTGTNPNTDPDLYKQWSPVNFITKNSAPTLILHGAKDPMVDISQSKTLQAKLEEAGVTNELVVYLNQRHGWHGSTLSNSFDKIGIFLENLKSER